MNNITITGMVTRTPVIKGKIGGNRKCTLNIAVKRDQGSDIDFFDAVIIGTKKVDSIEKYLHEGSKVLITGPVYMRKSVKMKINSYFPEIEIKTIEYLSNYGDENIKNNNINLAAKQENKKVEKRECKEEESNTKYKEETNEEIEIINYNM